MTFRFSRRSLMAGAAGATAASLVGAPGRLLAQAAATPPSSAPSYTRTVGDAEVTVFLDGHFLLEQAWINTVEPATVASGLEAAYLDPTSAVPLPITAYVVRRGDEVTLLDAGAGASLGPTAGALAQRLTAAGLPPETITRLLVSHMHPDHIGGMLAGEAAVFPNATVRVSDVELAFWTDDARAAAAPEGTMGWFDLARAVAATYRGRITTFTGEADLGDGISAVPLPGHTPGHTGYRVSDGDAQLLLWGDSTSLASLQFSHPETGIVFDTDSALAEQTRRRVLDMARADRLLVAGTHLPFPGFGHVERRGEAYAWVPEEWRLL